jgi:phage shock protein C
MSRSYARRRTLYRSRQGKILGVCRGIAEYFDVQVKWVRIIAVIALIFTGFWPAVAIYLLAAYLMKPEPVLPMENEAEEEFYNSYAASRSMALGRLKRQFDNLDRRIQRMENHVTTREYSWEQRLNS